MAAKIPDALQMRSLKYRGSTDAAKDAVAQALLAADRRSEAILLFDGRPEAPVLQEERAWAIQTGVAFHLLGLSRLGVEITPADWQACAAVAEKAERWMDARQCYVLLEDEAGLERIAEHLPPSLRPVPNEPSEPAAGA